MKNTKKKLKPTAPTTITPMQELSVDLLRTIAAGQKPGEECKK